MLAAWSGLGYNRRALALQAAARVVAERGWPDDLTALPGVGPYTAAAVGSFAWDRQEAAVDTNVRRVFERYDGVARGPAALAARARAALPPGQAAGFNQAMMELGRDDLPSARATLQRVPSRSRLRRRRELPAARAGAGGSRTPIAGRAAASWRRCWRRNQPPREAIAGDRGERVLAGLERDGLISRAADGAPALPA